MRSATCYDIICTYGSSSAVSYLHLAIEVKKVKLDTSEAVFLSQTTCIATGVEALIAVGS